MTDAPGITTIEFWPGESLSIDLNFPAIRSIPVKGFEAPRPQRFLELFANIDRGFAATTGSTNHLKQRFFPKIPGVTFEFGEHLEQPPFSWRNASAQHLAVSFFYTTNAFYRILSGLAGLGRINVSAVNELLDKCCLELGRLYLANRGWVLRNINNNLNMFFISKVVEQVVGKRAYDADLQEPDATAESLRVALELISEHRNADTLEKIAVAMGRGISFVENKFVGGTLDKAGRQTAQETAFRLSSAGLAIDHRKKLFELIESEGVTVGRFRLVVILDDTTESVDDLLWIQDLLVLFSFLEVDVVTNDAQISINFSSAMLPTILGHPAFAKLSSMSTTRFRQTSCYCPLISFQTNYLQTHVRGLIGQADAVFVKG
ncbi:MAG TPA: hypothetical protein VM260_12095, partial [Pirellula sp.]|nr:hypothetical protein [Pirellula sp.]